MGSITVKAPGLVKFFKISTLPTGKNYASGPLLEMQKNRFFFQAVQKRVGSVASDSL
jgi:hypothetical protein